MKKRYLRACAALVCAISMTTTIYLILGADSGIAYLSIYAFLGVSIAFIRESVPSGKKGFALSLLQGLFFSAGAAIIIISLNLTPASAYLAWFRIAQDGHASGVLSFMFSVKACFFSTLFSSAMIRRGVLRPLLGLLSILLVILYAIFQIQAIAITALALLALAVTASALRTGLSGRHRIIFSALAVIALTAGSSVLLALIRPRAQNLLVAPIDGGKLSKTVVKIYPDFPFLYNMPGYGHQLGSSTIGSQPSLTSRPVFEVTGNPGETVYLRTAVYDHYTGSGWAFYKNRMTAAEKGYETHFLESDGKIEEIENPLKIEVLIDFFSSVPHTVSTSGIYYDNGRIPDLVYGSLDTGFLFKVPVVKGTEFILNRGGYG